eukprot:TRINITY_DN13530_c0_g1_i1.p1 TRINITY_DN13530_c0_g1~~TRINITY_DN13530_c0_g1_i1.p1  ORF type:complete len:151 (-),score=30.61 TRINITY_DN13530_c0_g1_i1:49-501(-)
MLRFLQNAVKSTLKPNLSTNTIINSHTSITKPTLLEFSRSISTRVQPLQKQQTIQSLNENDIIILSKINSLIQNRFITQPLNEQQSITPINKPQNIITLPDGYSKKPTIDSHIEEFRTESVVRKRRTKMNKHRHKKARKLLKFQRRKLKK